MVVHKTYVFVALRDILKPSHGWVVSIMAMRAIDGKAMCVASLDMCSGIAWAATHVALVAVQMTSPVRM